MEIHLVERSKRVAVTKSINWNVENQSHDPGIIYFVKIDLDVFHNCLANFNFRHDFTGLYMRPTWGEVVFSCLLLAMQGMISLVIRLFKFLKISKEPK